MVSFGKDRFPPGYQYGVGWKGMDRLHDSSKRMIEIFKQYDIISKDDLTVCEIGSGPGRNFQYIYNENQTTKFYSNDLWEETTNYLMGDMKTLYENGNFEFTAMDTEDYVNSRDLKVDIFISLAHFMHLQYDKAENIIKRVRDVWQPTYIYISEINKNGEDVNHPKLYHDYTLFDEKYDIIHSEDLQIPRLVAGEWRKKVSLIRLYKLKG